MGNGGWCRAALPPYHGAVSESTEGSGAAKERGLFIVLDGVDGCGKSTQARRLVERLGRVADCEVPLHLREPGSTPLGERVRALLLETDLEIGPAAEALLFAACRRQTLDALVAPALARGRHVVCERFHASTFAYQMYANRTAVAAGSGSGAGGAAALCQAARGEAARGQAARGEAARGQAARGAAARGNDEGGDDVLGLLRSWAGAPRPDLELILDLSPAEAAGRRAGAPDDRIESRGAEYLSQVVDGYREYAGEREERAVLVAGNGDADEVAERIWAEVCRVR